jgi:hypothetical protein
VYSDREFEERVNKMIDLLFMKGLIEISSVDSNTGEFLYQFSPDIKEIVPNFEEDSQKMFLENLDVLWIKGFIAMDKTEENPIVSLTDIAFDPESVAKLAVHERTVLYTIMEAMKHEKGL